MIRTWLACVVVAAVAMVGAGCQKDHDHSNDKMAGAGDVCAHCPGYQKGTADGKCESCGMKLVDYCPKCAGYQTATADGKCPVCGWKPSTNGGSGKY